MISATHQSLLLWGARLAGDGFAIGGFEGPAMRAGIWNSLPAPFDFHGMRPDAWGVRPEDGLIAFVEAKTERDVDTAHTRTQLGVLGRTRMRHAMTCCPRTSELQD